ncbi:unnamed protein product [Effrenium voratum]|uniref:Reverse transcriptase n=1 Tax=Effrenium voratum TaxID=2562239 RepID=A0AA36HPN1_9DINO|nr:unnamed protein product [Effrenium voratum]
MRGALVNHVDDILLAAPKEEIKELQKSLSEIFPISEWESDTFEYIGSDIEQNDNSIHVGQSNYVKSRLETVDIPKGVNPEEVADEVTRLDNQSVVGGLSWLASQTRPDLQTGVSMAQRKQTHRLSEERCRHVVPIVPITDCRSLYDTNVKAEGLRRSDGRRTWQHFGKSWMRWVPTDYQAGRCSL